VALTATKDLPQLSLIDALERARAAT